MKAPVQTSRIGRLALLAALIGACSPGEERSPDGARISSSGDAPTTITVLVPWGIDPSNPLDLPELLFDSPFGYRDGELDRPKLVTGVERLEDGRTFRYRLRPNIRWHDGTPFTTRDIAFTRRLKQHPAVALDDPASSTLSVLDDSTFEITYHRGREGLLNWEVYYPAHLLSGRDPVDWQQWDYWREPVGYGPYRFVRRSREFFELEANPDYYLGRPRIDRLVFKLGGNPLTELKSGAVDLAIVANNQQAELLTRDPRFRTYWYVSAKLHRLYWNLRHPILGDVRVRRALSLAIDRREMLEALDFPGKDMEAAAGGVMARLWTRPWDVPATVGQIERGETPDPLPHDPRRARALLSEAGWEDEDGDGVRERNGEPLEFRLLADPGRETIAVLLQAQFGAVGARVVIDMKDRSVALEQFRAADFDAVLASSNGDLAARALTGRGTESGESYTGFHNPEFNRLSRAATWTVEEAEDILRDLWPILREDLPVTLLTPTFASMTVAHRRVKGLESPMWAPFARIPWLWIEEDER